MLDLETTLIEEIYPKLKKKLCVRALPKLKFHSTLKGNDSRRKKIVFF